MHNFAPRRFWHVDCHNRGHEANDYASASGGPHIELERDQLRLKIDKENFNERPSSGNRFKDNG